jgi:lysyl-tRNA synthetase, class II
MGVTPSARVRHHESSLLPHVKPVHLERHRLGPRVFVLGTRIHEWHLGLVLASAYLAAVWLGVLHVHYSAALALPVAALWLIVKDWRDLFRSQRDTASWQLGLHRPVPPLRPVRRFDSLPALTAVLALLAAVANGSAAVFDGALRHDLLFQLRPLSSIPVFQTLAVPAAAALALTSLYLYRRRRAAWALAVATFLATGAVELGRRSFVDATASFAAAAVLFWGRGAFPVRTDGARLRAVTWRLPTVLATWLVGAFGVLWIAAPAETGPGLVAENTGRLLLWQAGTIGYYDEARAIPPLVRALGLLILLAAAYVACRRPVPERRLPGPELRRAAASLVRAHGDDTLAFFKLREDTQYLFDATRQAFFAYRIEAGTMLISGDPVGPEEALPDLIRAGCALADRYGLKLGVVGASGRTLPLFGDAGLRALYVGDEAIVDTDGFSLDGRAIRKVRQSVHRLEKAGFSIALEESGSLTDAARLELELLAEDWRQGAPERGFSMALDSLRGAHHAETLLAVARDLDGVARGFIQFVPTYGRSAVSLSMMRRDRSAPNGLTEYMIVRAIELLRERDVAEASLNFAAFARWMHDPRNRAERLFGRLVALANPYFQIESLYRFNAKFAPRWEPRFLLYERLRDLPRTALATLWAEGQLAKPPAPRLRRLRTGLAAD